MKARLLAAVAAIALFGNLAAQSGKSGFAFAIQPSTNLVIPALTYESFGVDTGWNSPWLPDRVGVNALFGWQEQSVQFGYDIHASWWLKRGDVNVDAFIGAGFVGQLEDMRIEDFVDRLGLVVGVRIW